MRRKKDYAANEQLLNQIVAKAKKQSWEKKRAARIQAKEKTRRSLRQSLLLRDCVAWLDIEGYEYRALSEIPTNTPGIYVVVSIRREEALYVGQSANVRSRVSGTGHPYRIAARKGYSPILFTKKVYKEDLNFEECLAIGHLRPGWNFGKAPK